MDANDDSPDGRPHDEDETPQEGDVEVIDAEAQLSDTQVIEAEAEIVDLDALSDAETEGGHDGDFVETEAEAIDATPASKGRGKRRKAAGTALAPSSARALSRTDPLEAYMRDVNRYQVLSADDQHALAVKYLDTGDVDAAAQLVTTNLRLVVKLAYEYRKAHRNVMDLIQEGNIGLMHAVKKYDPYKGVKLSSYAAWWIRAYILRFALNNSRLVKLGTTQAQRKLFFNLNKEKAKLSAMGIEPTAEVIADRLNVKPEEVTSMDRRLAAGDMSLDAPVSGDGGNPTSRVEMLASGSADIADTVADEQMGALLREHLAGFGEGLEGKEKRIYFERLLTEEPLTLQQLGEDFGVSRERVRQLEKRLQGKLRTYLEDKLGSEALEP